MRISWVRVQNYRCIEDLKLEIHDYTSLIGPNNSGKSTILHAMDLMLSGSKPVPEDWRRGAEDKPLVIEMIFRDLEDHERNISGVAGLVYDGRIHLRMTAEQTPDARSAVSQTFEVKKREERIEGWSKKYGDLSPELQEFVQSLGFNGNDFRKVTNRERVREQLRRQHPELVSLGPEGFVSDGVSIPQGPSQALPRPILIPAVGDAAQEAKPGTKTAFGQLLAAVLLPAVRQTDEFQDMERALEGLQIRLDGDGAPKEVGDLISSISSRLAELLPATVRLDIQRPDFDKALSAAVRLNLLDGDVETTVDRQGHGVQRALIFALLEAVGLSKEKARSTGPADSEGHPVRSLPYVLLFEEPELYIHPHLMRKLKRILLGMASKMGWQVMVTTHSPFLVDVAEDPCSLVVLRARSGSLSSTCQQLSKSPFESQDRRTERDALRAALDFHPTVCEAFFGNDTVLVEGASEMAILRHSDAFLEACGLVPAKTEDVSVVSCGGKWTILAMARLLKSFEIPIRVIHDGDRRSRSEDELEACRPIDPFRVNAALDEILDPSQLFACDDTLEDLLWPDREKHSTTNKPYQAWLRARQLVEEDLDLSNTHPELWEMVRFAFGGDDRRQ